MLQTLAYSLVDLRNSVGWLLEDSRNRLKTFIELSQSLPPADKLQFWESFLENTA